MAYENDFIRSFKLLKTRKMQFIASMKTYRNF